MKQKDLVKRQHNILKKGKVTIEVGVKRRERLGIRWAGANKLAGNALVLFRETKKVGQE